MNTSPRQYPAMHPEKRSRALLLILIVATVAWLALMVYSYAPGIDQPANFPDPFTETTHAQQP